MLFCCEQLLWKWNTVPGVDREIVSGFTNVSVGWLVFFVQETS